MEDEVVWLKELRKFAFLVKRNAFYSTVEYYENGICYEVDVENDDYEFWNERAIEYEPDE